MAKTNKPSKPKSNSKIKHPEQQPEQQPIPEEPGTTESIPEVVEIPTQPEPETPASIPISAEIEDTKQPIINPELDTSPVTTESIVHLSHADLYPFKNHPFQLRDDDDMRALVSSVKERGIDQPAIVRPRENGGYELIAGHRRQYAAASAGYSSIPCIVRNMSDEEAVITMTESNFNQRSEILASERAKALKMQLDAIKRQGSRNGIKNKDELGTRSNEIIAERNRMSSKNVQRYIALNNLVPELMEKVDEKKLKFTTAVDLSYIKAKNQRYIALAIDAQETAPSGTQAQRLRELDQKDILNADVIDGIFLEQTKEEVKVILTSQELGDYFGEEKSPREMKEQIMKLLDEWKEKQPPELTATHKPIELEK
ncbi:MAG: ParB/RepB/Spo0J family partition protein [Dehalococcoidia bacterium]|nr:ParB/RepB/Spo0J family partition protein [Dehalococcoidia bacterium]